MPRPKTPPKAAKAHSGPWLRGTYQSIQVNVDDEGNNILGDAANEPSIAVDPTDSSRIAIGWRQFDSVKSDFRQAGRAYSQDGGLTWTFPGVLEPGVFRSDPVLDADAEGNFYYYSLYFPNGLYADFACALFKSTDGGVTWSESVYAYGGDKAWMAIDRTNGIGRGNLYFSWDYVGCCGDDKFMRSIDGGATFDPPVGTKGFPEWGTISVGPGGEVYVAGGRMGFSLARSTNARDPNGLVTFDLLTPLFPGSLLFQQNEPNPGGLVGQAWVATDHSGGATHGNVYFLASAGIGFETDVLFARSDDGGRTFGEPVRVNDDPIGNGAWQWFGTMSVAPNGRIDVIWNDTRNTGADNLSELYYSYSSDGGDTWSTNEPVSPVFNSHIGWPNQSKIGDYYDMVSDNAGVNIAYAATFNGEQDVYFLRIGMRDCNGNSVADEDDLIAGTSEDCDGNNVPDECQRDCNHNGAADVCEILQGTAEDCDGNRNLDECQRDCDRNGAADICEILLEPTNDCNENLRLDACEQDFDGDGLIDDCDIDVDGDGVLNGADICPFTPIGTRVNLSGGLFGDTDGNCELDLVDYTRFVSCIADGGPFDLPDRAGCLHFADIDGDEDVDLGDFAAFQDDFDVVP